MQEIYSPFQRALLVIFLILLYFAFQISIVFGIVGPYFCLLIFFAVMTFITKKRSEYSYKPSDNEEFAKFIDKNVELIIILSHLFFSLLGLVSIFIVQDIVHKILIFLIAIGFIVNGVIAYNKVKH